MPGLMSIYEVKDHLRISVNDQEEEAYISSAADDAVAAIEDATGLVLEPGTVVETFSRFDRVVQLRAWPVTSITSVEYLDDSGTLTTLSADRYRLAMGKRPARIAPIGMWPRALGDRFSGADDAITVTFEAGYAAGDVPLGIMRAVKLMLGHFYENREAAQAGDRAAAVELPLGVELLLRRYKIRTL